MAEDELPFYYRASGKQILSKLDLVQFKKDNPELAIHVSRFDFKYKTIDFHIFKSFSYWIIGQQLSARSADSITKRYLKLVDPLTPENVLSFSIEELRATGLSRSKASYLHNVARFLIVNSDHPMVINSDGYSSDELRKFYTQVKGVGPWTVNMHLIFVLGKKDVYATGDLAVRKGIKVLYNLKETPTERECKKSYNWGKLATVGTFLSWAVIGE